eukprot:TRINITY_DN29273_c0_g2_i1.p1 TRINITY_DN29273_c0_g2~~TRINITY_DN29273_c0_g2_i1.p1  ORF type:complete len:1631 (-),score=341.02 TRINITY_DN29273_c0_g2_i1:63-4883(-)
MPPRAVELKGAVGPVATRACGVYLPVYEMSPGRALYRRDGGGVDLWLGFSEEVCRWLVYASTENEGETPLLRSTGIAAAASVPEGVRDWESSCPLRDGCGGLTAASGSVSAPHAATSATFEPQLGLAVLPFPTRPVEITGVEGSHASLANGVYRPCSFTNALAVPCCGLNTYTKEGSTEIWLGFVDSVRCWMVQSTADRGSEEGILRSVEGTTLTLTPEAVEVWQVRRRTSWETQIASISVRSVAQGASGVRVAPGNDLQPAPKDGSSVYGRLYAGHAAKMERLAQRREDAEREEAEREEMLRKTTTRYALREEVEQTCQRLYEDAGQRQRRLEERRQAQLSSIAQPSVSTPMLSVRSVDSWSDIDGEPAWERLHREGPLIYERRERAQQQRCVDELQEFERNNIHSRRQSVPEAFDRLYNQGLQRERRLNQQREEQALTEFEMLEQVSVHRRRGENPGGSGGPIGTLADETATSAHRLYADAANRRERLGEMRLASCRAASGGSLPFVMHTGLTLGGVNLLAETMTIEEAKRRLPSVFGCKGFAIFGRPTDALFKVFFKSGSDLQDSFGWTCFVPAVKSTDQSQRRKDPSGPTVADRLYGDASRRREEMRARRQEADEEQERELKKDSVHATAQRRPRDAEATERIFERVQHRGMGLSSSLRNLRLDGNNGLQRSSSQGAVSSEITTQNPVSCAPAATTAPASRGDGVASRNVCVHDDAVSSGSLVDDTTNSARAHVALSTKAVGTVAMGAAVAATAATSVSSANVKVGLSVATHRASCTDGSSSYPATDPASEGSIVSRAISLDKNVGDSNGSSTGGTTAAASAAASAAPKSAPRGQPVLQQLVIMAKALAHVASGSQQLADLPAASREQLRTTLIRRHGTWLHELTLAELDEFLGNEVRFDGGQELARAVFKQLDPTEVSGLSSAEFIRLKDNLSISASIPTQATVARSLQAHGEFDRTSEDCRQQTEATHVKSTVEHEVTPVTACSCGVDFLPDSVFCRRCGIRKPVDPPPTRGSHLAVPNQQHSHSNDTDEHHWSVAVVAAALQELVACIGKGRRGYATTKNRGFPTLPAQLATAVDRLRVELVARRHTCVEDAFAQVELFPQDEISFLGLEQFLSNELQLADAGRELALAALHTLQETRSNAATSSNPVATHAALGATMPTAADATAEVVVVDSGVGSGGGGDEAPRSATLTPPRQAMRSVKDITPRRCGRGVRVGKADVLLTTTPPSCGDRPSGASVGITEGYAVESGGIGCGGNTPGDSGRVVLVESAAPAAATSAASPGSGGARANGLSARKGLARKPSARSSGTAFPQSDCGRPNAVTPRKQRGGVSGATCVANTSGSGGGSGGGAVGAISGDNGGGSGYAFDATGVTRDGANCSSEGGCQRVPIVQVQEALRRLAVQAQKDRRLGPKVDVASLEKLRGLLSQTRKRSQDSRFQVGDVDEGGLSFADLELLFMTEVQLLEGRDLARAVWMVAGFNPDENAARVGGVIAHRADDLGKLEAFNGRSQRNISGTSGMLRPKTPPPTQRTCSVASDVVGSVKCVISGSCRGGSSGVSGPPSVPNVGGGSGCVRSGAGDRPSRGGSSVQSAAVTPAGTRWR